MIEALRRWNFINMHINNQNKIIIYVQNNDNMQNMIIVDTKFNKILTNLAAKQYLDSNCFFLKLTCFVSKYDVKS